MTQAGREHATQCCRLVHVYAQRQTLLENNISQYSKLVSPCLFTIPFILINITGLLFKFCEKLTPDQPTLFKKFLSFNMNIKIKVLTGIADVPCVLCLL